MRRSTVSFCCLLPALLAPNLASSAVGAPEDRKTRRRRRSRYAAYAGTAAARSTRLDTTPAELRGRWVEILAASSAAGGDLQPRVRSETARYEAAEVLADRLLGEEQPCVAAGGPPSRGGVTFNFPAGVGDLSGPWRSVLAASSVLLLAALAGAVVASPFFRDAVTAANRSITPHLVPTVTVVRSSVRNAVLHVQALWYSRSYLLRHFNRVRPLPFLYKLIRKCVIIECWRHIWLRVYQLTRYMWKGTTSNAKTAYVRVVPAWIRRGVKSMFKSMVQSQVHGLVGSAAETVLEGVTFESWVGYASAGDVGGDAAADVVIDSAAQGLEATVTDALETSLQGSDLVDSVVSGCADSMDGVAEEAIESIAESASDAVESVVDNILESIDSSVSEGVDVIAEVANSIEM